VLHGVDDLGGQIPLALLLGFTDLPVTDDLKESGNWACRSIV
jgi:hypothetical protein